ncbi:alpha/beta hydrolase [uncultured Acinetobacter sp.]|uniref:alpha/beta hydrolase n=1 Tax=Acinetobacter sp. TaxID=472 RepID=UPI002611B016|nr:alpha/beta hydrolase [uncultured Acinetobacter sp.]
MASLLQFPLHYDTDPLTGFDCATINLPDDHEGAVIAKLIRHTAPHRTPKAVLYIHGFIDYFFQTELAQQFNEHGYDFYALDLRKYGRALLPHQRAYDVHDLREYDAEIHQTLDVIWREGHQSLILAGHSTGGLICTSFAARHSKHPLIKALWLNSPFFDFNLNHSVQKFLLHQVVKLANMLPNLAVPSGLNPLYVPSLHQDFDGEWCFDLKLKPQHYPWVRLSFIHAVYRVQQQLQQGISLHLPTLVMHSQKSSAPRTKTKEVNHSDIILNVDDIVRCAKQIQGDVSIVAVEGALHDVVLSQPAVRAFAYQQLFAWLQQKAL